MKTITLKADDRFDAELTRLAESLKTTKSQVIRTAVQHYGKQLEKEALARRIREASLKVRLETSDAELDFGEAAGMGFKRGDIHLANFNPSKGTEAGKIRPCLVVQCDALNEAEHPSTTVIPLTTQINSGAAPLRLKIRSRGRLREDSDIMIDQIRTIDNRRLTGETLARLTPRELVQVSEYLKVLLDL